MLDWVTTLYGKLDRALVRMVNRGRLLRLRLQGAHLGEGVRAFGAFQLVGDARNLTIGAGSTINPGVLFNLRAPIEIGRNVHLSAATQLHTARLRIPVADGIHDAAPITIGDHVWLGAGVVVGAGVSIGEGAVVGANSVVLRDVDRETLCAGAPARIVRRLGVTR
jgi:acetyltransferase-like isoleucine patch superfamily enzyme